MRNFCGALVRGLGGAWPVVGWLLWTAILIIPFIPFLGTVLLPVYWAARLLLGAWMLVDLVDQDKVSGFFGSAVLFVFVALVVQPGGIFFIVGWLLYWNAVRKKS